MTGYMTKQRKILLDFLSRERHRALTAKQIVQSLDGQSISISAVYRTLSELEKCGVVKRTSKAGSREAYYQYTASPECHGHLHLSCRKCGRIHHMDAAGTELLLNSIAQNESFVVDKAETVLYGVCIDCQE